MLSCLNYILCLNKKEKRRFQMQKERSSFFTDPSTSHSPEIDDTKKITILNNPTYINHTNRIHWNPTLHEKELLIETWSEDFDFLYSIGTKIYEYIFDHNPNTKELFPAIHQHGDKWKESSEFRDMALKFVQTLSMCIDMLDDIMKAAERLRAIGEKHVQYAHRGFKPIYWDIFHDALQVSLSEHLSTFKNFDDEKLREAKNTWKKLALFIITHMKRGYVRKLVKEFQAQDEALGVWLQKHPSFKTVQQHTKIKNNLNHLYV